MSSEPLATRFDVRALGVLAFGISYYALAHLSLAFVGTAAHAATIWAPSGLALGVFVLAPRRWWPALAAAVFVASALAASLSDGPHSAGYGLATVNAIEPALAASLLLVVIGPSRVIVFGSARWVAALLAAAAGANAATSLAAALLHADRVAGGLAASAAWTWAAHGIGMLIITPLVVGLMAGRKRRLAREEVVIPALTAALSLALFAPFAAGLPVAVGHPYWLLALLAWCAVRATPRTTSLAVAIVGTVGTVATVMGSGPFAEGGPAPLEGVEALTVFLAAGTLLSLVLGGVLFERTALETRLGASAELLSSVLRAATEFSVVGTDTSGTITVFNEGAERLLGYRADELVGCATPAVYHDPHEVIARALELGIAPGFDVFVHALRLSDSETREWTCLRKDGRRLRVSLTVTAMWDAAGNLAGYIGIGRDVTTSSRAEAERSALERVSRAVAGNENLDVILSLVASEAGRLHGAASALITRFDHGDVGTIIGAWNEEGWLSSLRVDLTGDSATALVRRTGDAVRVRAIGGDDDPAGGGPRVGIGVPIVVGGRVWGAIGLEIDATETRAEDPRASLGRFAALVSLAVRNADYHTALLRRGDELSAIVEGLPGMVWVRSRSGHLMLANGAYNDAMSPDPLTGAPRDGVSESLDESGHAEARAAGHTTYSETTMVGESGEERRLLVARSPLTDRSGDVYAFCCVATDITERHEMERAKDELVSIVSHELRTPLSSIRGALSLLVDDADELPADARRRMLEIALANSKRLATLVNDILDLQRITSGATELEMQACDGGELVVQAVEAMTFMAVEAGVEIEASRSGAPLRADPGAVLQVLNNLLGNAIKFTPPGGHVSAGVTRVGDEVRMFVRDDGRGIPADKLETIFGRFEQVDSSDSRLVGGTGLGLAICREIAGQHGGRVWAESELGVGSCFWLALPSPSPSTGAPDSAAPPPAGSVLICDGDSEARARAGAVVGGLGLVALEAASGRAAVRLAETRRPSVALLHLDAPGMDGLVTAKALASSTLCADIPVIVASGAASGSIDGPGPSIDRDSIPPGAERLAQALTVSLALAAPKRALVVEDDEDRAAGVMEMLRRAGVAATHARTGAQAMELAADARPDLIVLDAGLPDGDGFAVAEALWERGIRPAALVVHSAMDLDEAARERLHLGATEFAAGGVR